MASNMTATTVPAAPAIVVVPPDSVTPPDR
jgi:hypothetical protein